MTAPPLYRLADIRQRYAARVVLALPALDVVEGETLAILGPSGAGKSTLLRLLQFIEPPSEGTIVFRGDRIDGMAPLELRRRVTTVFQHPLMLDRSVEDNVAYGLKLRRADDARGTSTALLERLGLADLARHPARLLSGGEIQRVALARALAFDPLVLLLDEPTANLDPYNAALIERMIREQQARGVTIVLVTHHAAQARRLASRIGLLLDGRMTELGPTRQVLEAPSDRRTLAFLNGDLIG
jgi:tungstate transport system ATP-binding protein